MILTRLSSLLLLTVTADPLREVAAACVPGQQGACSPIDECCPTKEYTGPTTPGGGGGNAGGPYTPSGTVSGDGTPSVDVPHGGPVTGAQGAARVAILGGLAGAAGNAYNGDCSGLVWEATGVAGGAVQMLRRLGRAAKAASTAGQQAGVAPQGGVARTIVELKAVYGPETQKLSKAFGTGSEMKGDTGDLRDISSKALEDYREVIQKNAGKEVVTVRTNLLDAELSRRAGR